MASVTVDSAATANTADGGALRLDSIPTVDLRCLSQSELYSLSRRSSSAFDPSRRDDVVIPIIDRSVFNESAGSRKQTYSRLRLRLAPSSSSSSATTHRRTPHLRSTATTFGSLNNKSDPETAENAKIINLLKQIFVADMNPEDLVPVRIEYSNSIPMQQFSSLPPLPSSNVGIVGQKRKRGRPRRGEVFGNERALIIGSGVVDVDVGVSDADGFSSLNETFVRENAEERDREVLNKDGVAVDLVALGALEHPYSDEIRRRTEGMQEEVEFFEFLKGLNGQWGSRRKKKRIVDANEFGSVLPIGWKLSLSIKRKTGHVWLYCRRYISPSGLHFVSCKGVSSYLLSLHGVQDTNLPGSAHYNEMLIDSDGLTSVPIQHLAIEEVDKMENLISHASSPALGSTMVDHERQVQIHADSPPENTTGENLRCNKSNITSSEKDELLQHQSSLRRRNRHKNGTRITDGVIIKDGKFECQFCHKIFIERHRYNGHVGNHVKYQAKTAGESSETVIPNPLNEFCIQDVPIEGSLRSDNAVKNSNSITNNGLNICSPPLNNNEHVGVLKGADGNTRMIDEATDIVPETNLCSLAENKSFGEVAQLNDSGAGSIDDGSSLQERRSYSSLPLNNATNGVTNDGGIDNYASTKKSDLAFESCLLDSINNVEECIVVNNTEHIDQTRKEHNLDFEKFAVDGSILDSFGSQGNQDNNLDSHVKEKSDLESLPCNKPGASDSTSASGSEASKLNKDPNISIPHIAHDEKACTQVNDPCSIMKGTVDEALSVGDYENESSKADNDGANSLDRMQFGIALIFPSWDDEENASQKDDTEALDHMLEMPGVEDNPKSQLVEGRGRMYCYESNDDGVCREKTEVSEFDAFQNFENGESSDPFSNSHAGINSNSITGAEQGNEIGVCSRFLSASDKQLFTEDNMIRMLDDTLAKHRQEPSRGILLGQSGVSEVSDDAHTLNKIYATPAIPFKLNKFENTGKNELSLSFGNLQTAICTVSNGVEQESYQASNFNIDSFVHKSYKNQSHLNTVSSNIPADLKQDRVFGVEFPNSSFNNRAHELGTNFNMADTARDWSGTGDGNLGAPGQNFVVGFGNGLQSGERAGADMSWRSGHENVFEGCFDANSGPQIPSAGPFRTFGLTLDKGEGGSLGANKNYDMQSDIFRPGRIQPVEHSFMGERSSNSLPGEAKILAYNPNMEQGLDPSFWLGKDALTHNASHTSQVTSVCVWCRNVFFHEPLQPGIQTGAIGTMCPSCTSRIPGHFNVL